MKSIIVIVVLLFALASTAIAQDDLAGTAWQLVSIDGEPVLEDTAITLNFGTDGSVGGRGGCNTYGSGYTLDGSTISFTNIFSTMMACGGDVMTQEGVYFTALNEASGYTLTDEQLTITYGDDQKMVFAPLFSLSDTSWALASLGDSDVIGSITLEFDAEGRFAGSGGCNRYMGSYNVDDDTIRFSEALSTRRACMEEGVMEQEQTYFEALETAGTFAVSDDQLTIDYADGQLVYAAMPVVTVEVLYRERIALPPQAQITAQLQDISLADAPAVVLATETITAEDGSVPFVFELAYDPNLIQESNTYAVRAEIRLDGDLLFTTDTIHPVITHDNPDEATIVLVRVN